MASDQGFSFNFQLPSVETTPTSEDDAGNRKAETSRSTKQSNKVVTTNFQFLTDIEERLKDISIDDVDSAIAVKKCSGDKDNSHEHLRRVCDYKKSNHAEEQNSDIIPGEYEGGLKIWECSLDLCRYLLQHLNSMRPKFVAELGCGHGLPGCLLLQNALRYKTNARILFADFNDFVIKDVTMLNVLLNTRDFKIEEVAKSVAFGVGDWNQMSTAISDNLVKNSIEGIPSTGRFDLLLAAETTYTLETAKSTANLFARHLSPVNGVGLVATKRYYFGCGGGTEAFCDAASDQKVMIDNMPYKLDVNVVEVFDNGAGNIRELLQVVLKAVG